MQGGSIISKILPLFKRKACIHEIGAEKSKKFTVFCCVLYKSKIKTLICQYHLVFLWCVVKLFQIFRISEDYLVKLF